MSKTTTNRGWTYPTAYLKPYYTIFFDMFEEIDADVQLAFDSISSEDFWERTGTTIHPKTSGDFLRVLATGVSVDTILDEDNMVSDSATALCTQQSIKKYVDDSIAVENLWDRSGTEISPHFANDTVKITQNGANPSIILDGTNREISSTATAITNDLQVGTTSIDANLARFVLYTLGTATASGDLTLELLSYQSDASNSNNAIVSIKAQHDGAGLTLIELDSEAGYTNINADLFVQSTSAWTFSIADTINKIPLSISQNDITNTPTALKVTAPGYFSSGIDSAGHCLELHNYYGTGYPAIIGAAVGEILIIQTHTTTSQFVGSNVGSFSNSSGDCNFQGLAQGVSASFSGEATAILLADAPNGSSGNSQTDVKAYCRGTGTATSEDWVIGTAAGTGPISKEIRVHQQSSSNTNSASLSLLVDHEGLSSGDSTLSLTSTASAGTAKIQLYADTLIEALQAIQVKNSVAQYQYYDTDLTPTTGGLWRTLISSSGYFQVQENTAAGADFSTTTDWMTCGASAISVYGVLKSTGNGTYDLGASANKWKDIYLSGNITTTGTSPIWGMSASFSGDTTLTIRGTNAGAGNGYLKLTSDVFVWSDKTYRVQNTAPTFEWRDTDDPVDQGGLWHIALNGRNMSFRENTAVAGDFSTFVDWFKIYRSTSKITTQATTFIFDGGSSTIETASNGNLVLEPNGTGRVLFQDDADGNGALWKEYHISASAVSPGGSGATLGASGASAYYIMDAITEYLYFSCDMDDDWDANSDVQVEVYVALNGAETANDLIRASLRADYYTEHDNMSTSVKTQTRAIDHNIASYNAVGDVHRLVFILDYDLASNVIEAEDIIKLRFWLDDVTTAPVVTAVRFLFAKLKYRTKHAQPPFTSFASEG